MTQRHTLVVLTSPVEGRDAEFDEWYQDVHLPEVLQVPGFVAAQRFRIGPGMGGRSGATQRHAALYELETDDPAAALAALSAAARTMRMSDAMDRSSASAFLLTAAGERVECAGPVVP